MEEPNTGKLYSVFIDKIHDVVSLMNVLWENCDGCALWLMFVLIKMAPEMYRSKDFDSKMWFFVRVMWSLCDCSAATASAAYGGQTGYAVAPAATAATYGTQRAAATGYDTAYQAAAATQGA